MQPSLFSVRTPRFDGAVFDPAHDQDRLSRQITRIFDAVKDGRWRTLREIAVLTGDSESSISAQLRNLRKQRFGGYTVERRVEGGRAHGLYAYRVIA